MLGYLAATLIVASMKPNEVVKMSLCPVRASCSIARSASGAFGDVLDERRVDLVAERLHHRLAADVVLKGQPRSPIGPTPMNPTLSLSAADARGRSRRQAPELAAAATAKMIRLFMIFTPGWREDCQFTACARPRAAFSDQARRLHPSDAGAADPAVTARPRNQHENDHGGKIGQGRHQLRGHAEPERLGMELQDA